jgi:FKBP12-rapamycin complex-associated protein
LLSQLTCDSCEQGDRSEQRRYAAVLVLKEVAENAPTSFNVHVGAFLDRIWVALRDPKVLVREAAIEALRGCLSLIAKRTSKQRPQRYYRIFMEVQQVGAAATLRLP